MRQRPFLTVAAAGLAVLALAGCQTTGQQELAPQAQVSAGGQPQGTPVAQSAQATREDLTGRSSLAAKPREKPQYAKPLADMSCVELQEALVAYGTEIQRYGGRISGIRPSGDPITFAYYDPKDATGDVATAVVMGGALAGLVTAGIARGNWESFQDYKALHVEASKAFNERPCTQELDRIQEAVAAERSGMEQWQGRMTVTNPQISSIYAVRACAVHAREITVATDGQRAVGDIVDRSSFGFPLSGTYEPRGGRILLQGPGPQDASYRIKGKFESGAWT